MYKVARGIIRTVNQSTLLAILTTGASYELRFHTIFFLLGDLHVVLIALS